MLKVVLFRFIFKAYEDLVIAYNFIVLSSSMNDSEIKLLPVRDKINQFYSAFVTSVLYKNIKLLYYLNNTIRLLIPSFILRIRLKHKLKSVRQFEASYISERVNYYNKLEKQFEPSVEAQQIKTFHHDNQSKVYFFDTVRYARYFAAENRLNYVFGDVNYVPEIPSIVKSRPIDGDNANSVIMKLNRIRHFNFVNDLLGMDDKVDKITWRGALHLGHQNRIEFVQQYFDHPLCDVGHVSGIKEYRKWRVNRLNLYDQLKYKFIMCLEGNDVATNLKWVMSSNSLAVMPKPKFETWFMEGKLIPDYHYILVKDDFSDLIEKVQYYIDHPAEALQIVTNAHEYVAQFKNKKRENLISLLVLDKYFKKQINA